MSYSNYFWHFFEDYFDVFEVLCGIVGGILFIVRATNGVGHIINTMIKILLLTRVLRLVYTVEVLRVTFVFLFFCTK